MTSEREYLHVRPLGNDANCHIHRWPTEGLAKRLVGLMRAKHGKGGVDVCRPCLERARADAEHYGVKSLEDECEALEPQSLPIAWARIEPGRFRRDDGLRVLISVCLELDGLRWLHVSFSYKDRFPTWDDVGEVKRIFVGDDRAALQVFPRARDYVNHHPNCLHLWSCLDGDVTPDFTRGNGTI